VKLTITDLDNTYATSDNHFWHQNVIRYCQRPFLTVEEMNEKMIVYWNEVVGPNDTVYHLGDFSMAFRAVEAYTKRLNGKKILIAGNHDFVHPAHKKSKNEENQKKWIQNYLDNGWAEVHISGEIEIPGVATVNINHLPYLENSSGQDVRHGKYRPINDGRWLLCGHVHEKWAQRGKMINVGVDVRNFKPISFTEIAAIINSQPNGFPAPFWQEIPKEDY
jgi:calcineurin-like phosphoesterase family protein